MPPLKDRTNQRYGRLIVLKRAPNKGRGRVMWECRCDCGNICIVSGDCLQSGDTKSCGCLNTETRRKLGESNKKDLTGKKFGLLTVVEDSRQRVPGKAYVHLYRCLCDCGNEIIVRDSNLRSGNTQSCGCLKISHGELKIKTLLEEHNINFVQQYHPKDLIEFNGRFDFAVLDSLGDVLYFIEYDGQQHFDSYKDSNGFFKSNREYDLIKNTYCYEVGIPLIRIPYIVQKIKFDDINLDTSKYIISERLEKEYYAL